MSYGVAAIGGVDIPAAELELINDCAAMDRLMSLYNTIEEQKPTGPLLDVVMAGHQDVLEACECDYSLEGFRVVEDLIPALLKATQKLLLKILDGLRSFWKNHISLMAQREREARLLADEINIEVAKMKNKNPVFDIKPIMTTVMIGDEIIAPDEMATLASVTMNTLDPEKLVLGVTKILTYFLDAIKEETLDRDLIKSSRNEFFNIVTREYDMAVDTVKNKTTARLRVEEVPLVLELEVRNDSDVAVPKASLRNERKKRKGTVTGYTPSEASVAINHVARMMAQAKDRNNTVALERELSAVIKRLKSEGKSANRETQKLIKAMPAWSSLAVQFTRACSRYQYSVGIGMISFVKASRNGWTHK